MLLKSFDVEEMVYKSIDAVEANYYLVEVLTSLKPLGVQLHKLTGRT